jgi:hypothetical protein
VASADAPPERDALAYGVNLDWAQLCFTVLRGRRQMPFCEARPEDPAHWRGAVCEP